MRLGISLSNSNKVISIVGPTACGKTSLAISLAKHLSLHGDRAEIINADAYQMYKGMDIGTAKASPEEQASVPHHLLDIIEPNEVMTVAVFQRLARQCIVELQQAGVRPILVGGSGLYARAAIDDINFPGTDDAIRAKFEERARVEGASVLFEQLKALDPEAACRMDFRNVRRTIRALEVIEITGKPFSASLPRYRYVIPSVQIGLDIERSELDRRIEIRTQTMKQMGFIDEVASIRDRLGVTALRALGYQQMIDVLDGRMSEDEAFEDIVYKTRRLARKQMGWFGRDPRIHWVHANDPNIVSVVMDIVQQADNGVFDDVDYAADKYTQHHLGDIRDDERV